MATLKTGNVSLAYDAIGPAEARDSVLLIHGFSSNRNEAWRRVGWLGAFERRRQRAVAFDLRGHGESDKPHDPAAYATSELIGDIVSLIDALEMPRVTLMGYSMGARLALAATIADPTKFDRLILAGIGGRIFEPPPPGNPMAEAMEAENAASISDPLLRSFRHFADEQGDDRLALAACARARRNPVDESELGRINLPTLIVAGSRDELAGSADALAERIPGARGVTLPGCDHFSAIAHALFKAAVFDFLEDNPC